MQARNNFFIFIKSWLRIDRGVIVKIISRIFNAIPYLCGLLFTYSGIIKLLEYQDFTAQLGQSAMLLDMAGFITWFIPGVELIIAGLLLWPSTKTRLPGTLLFITLMVMFCAYILAILNFSEKVPCGCGGILGKLGSWKAHLALNAGFLILAVAYYISLRKQTGDKSLPTYLTLGIFALAAVTVVVVLFVRVDRHPNYRHNSFMRNYAVAALNPAATMDLKRADYYFAGTNTNKIYLANQMAFDRLLKVEQDLKDSVWLQLQLPKFSYRSIKVIVEPPYFYLSDGSGFSLFRGELSKHNASLYFSNTWFSNAVPLSSGNVTLLSMRDRHNKLAKKISPGIPEVFYDGLLKEQSGEGMFSTSGKLLYEPIKQRLLYLYNYRNEYLVMDTSFKLIHTGKTIDSVSQAKLKIGSLKNNTEFILQQSLLVNKGSCVDGNQLYINSNLLAKNEKIDAFEKRTVIDIYNYEVRRYLYSLSVPDYKGQKVREFKIIEDDVLIALQGNYLVKYHILKYSMRMNTGKRQNPV